MKRVILMVGLPRSGKSTWVRENQPKGSVIISADELRYIVYNQRFWGDGEPLMWALRGMMLKYLMQQGVDIVIDETNTTIERRKPIIKLAKQFGYYVAGNIVEGAWTDVCIERAEKTGQTDLIPIIQKMAEQFEMPEKEEGFDELNMV